MLYIKTKKLTKKNRTHAACKGFSFYSTVKHPGKDIVLKKTKKGRKYYGCIGNPDCDFMVWQKPSKEKCPKCGSLMLEKGNKLVCWNEDCGTVVEKKEN